MTLIQVSKLSFAYDKSYENVFEDVSFQMDSEWKLGFIGRNGRGKTTFLKLLLGLYAYKGEISSRSKFEYFPFEVTNPRENTRDVLAKLAPEAAPWQIEKEISLLQVKPDALERPFCSLSNGEQSKALLASLFLRNNRFLLIDEPTNHLDGEGRLALSQYLKSKKGFILVSHDRSVLDACADHILSINKCNIEIQKGNFSSWLQNKMQQDQFELAADERLRKEIKRLKIASRRNANWSDSVEKTKSKRYNASEGMLDKGYIGHKAAKLMSRSKAIESRQKSMLHEKEALLKNVEDEETLKLFPLAFHSKLLVELDDINIRYGEKSACQNITLRVEAGDRIALNGQNGSGKSSLFKLIMGEAIDYSGKLYRNQQLIVSYVPQNTAGMFGSLNTYMETYALNEKQFRIVLSQLEIPYSQFDLPIEKFSMGQKKKIALARSMCEEAHLYLWDEPLNYIDVISRMQIEEMLLKFKPSLIFAEHDRSFCEAIATLKVAL
ncbi:MAG: ABC-F type ribosomal protection protein [Anaerolineaceae bacterium]|nr:ABC-F type ribosomal protection protein [Anaerolineaceae bacterium]